jgi:hypothetical protein
MTSSRVETLSCLLVPGYTELFCDKLQFFFRTSQAFPAILDPAANFSPAPGL